MRQSMQSPDIVTKSDGIPDKHTPLLRNWWYVAAKSDEITRTPMRRTILNEDIVFYRTEDGKAVAVQNRCPHRSFPLHNGFLKGDRIVCNYHGIEFNPDGSCGHVPSLNAAPKALRLASYPLMEEGPFVWIWMGDQANPDYSRFFREPWWNVPKWTVLTGYMFMKANYLGMHENLMDLTHFAFLHSKWNLAKPEHTLAPCKVTDEGNQIRQFEVHEDVDFPAPLAALAGMKGPFNREAHHLARTPAMAEGHQITVDVSQPGTVDEQYITHYLTPETATSTHYYWALALEHGGGVPELLDQMQALASAAFAEDMVALEEIEAIQNRDHRPGFRDRIIKTDEGGIRVLRMFAKFAAEEQRQAAAA
jgi:phenylpropionate dioxygenase-like ring-hydroxylating dioxygenase large terminal subunit